MQVTDWFAVNYADARERFCAAAAASGAQLMSFRNPTSGPDGGALYTDVAYLGNPQARSIILTCSGTHGVEGFCGSGAQVGTFRSGLLRDMPKDVALVAIHAINPHGFAWQRRVTEENVDLNRNCLDHTQSHPKAENYSEIHRFLVPNEWTGPGREEADRAIDNFIQQRGIGAFQAAVTGGQYDYPDGMFFGGRAPTWGNRTLHKIIDRFLTGRKNIAFIDYHTGLGPSGYGELICTHKSGTKAHARTKSWYGSVTLPDDGSSASAPIQGYIAMALERALPDVEWTSIALEYGTVPVPDVLQAVRADNWLHQHGDIHSALGVAIKGQIRNAFYVETPLWKQQVWQRAAEITGKAMQSIAHT